MTNDSPIKVKPPTKSTPTLVSNTYACLTNDNDYDDDAVADVGWTTATNREPIKGIKMISQRMDELDNNDDDVIEPPPLVVEDELWQLLYTVA